MVNESIWLGATSLYESPIGLIVRLHHCNGHGESTLFAPSATLHLSALDFWNAATGHQVTLPKSGRVNICSQAELQFHVAETFVLEACIVCHCIFVVSAAVLRGRRLSFTCSAA